MAIRSSLLTLLVALAFGCGGSSSSHDASVSDQDLSVAATCYSIAECAFECTAGDLTCVQACVAKGSPTAQMAYTQLTTCGHGLCNGTDGGAPEGDGGGNGPCATATDTSAVCTQCVQSAIQSTPCASFETACLNE